MLYLGAQYTSKKENRGTGLLIVSDPITLATASVGVDAGRYQISVFVDNLSNEDGDMAADINRPGEVMRPRPRTIGAEIRASF